MKALTLTEPWASLVAIGAKRIETRSWGTDYRGPIAIHAAKGMTGDDVAFAQQDDVYDLLTDADVAIFPFGSPCGPVKAAFWDTRGKVIATATLAECFRFTRSQTYQFRSGLYVRLSDQEYRFGDITPGRFGWVLTNIVRLPEPVPAKGALGLWDFDVPDVPAAAD